MYSTLRTSIWLTLIGGGFFVIGFNWICVSDKAAGVSAFLMFGTCIAWGFTSSWLFGLRRRVRKFMRTPVDKLTCVSKDVGSSRYADYIRVLEAHADEQNAATVGIPIFRQLEQIKHGNIPLERIDFKSVEAEDGQLINLPGNAVYFLKYERTPVVVRVAGPPQEQYSYEQEDVVSTGKGHSLQILAGSIDNANAVLQWLTSECGTHSIYRGKLLQLASPQDGSTGLTIRITSRPIEQRKRIVLPDTILTVLERLIRARMQHREQLARYGHSSKLGILLHGPPGTGKTLVMRYLIARCAQHSVIVPTDMNVETLREAFRMAAYLQPAIMILEDVDLLAQDRLSARVVDGLQELMNQLDGLSEASDIIVLMSTNRPDVLEPALASRPGRVAQAMEFPLPDDSDRQRLLRLFLKDQAEMIDIEQWVNRTQNASPAFLQELCKRAILLAGDRNTTDGGFFVRDDDMDAAIHELVVMGGQITAKSLGFPQVPPAS